ncbi:MAG: pyrroloquinoline quinone biosynthesis protein PqqB, partial [Candidatus Paceibacterota bacterium]
ERDIVEEISKVDVALLDGTFYDQDELPNRDMSEIPHPYVEESLALFEGLPDSEKSKIMFIHFNHTNPLILDSPERREVEEIGYRVASERTIIIL